MTEQNNKNNNMSFVLYLLLFRFIVYSGLQIYTFSQLLRSSRELNQDYN